MKSFKTNYSDTQFTTAVQDICEEYKYQKNIVNDEGETVKNPITKKRFAQSIINKFISNITSAQIKKRKIKEATKDLTFDNLTQLDE